MRSLCLFLASVPFLWAQDTGRITGTVTDPSGAVVPRATVSLFLHDGAKAIATTATNSAGLFTLEVLRPVYYDLTIEASGFEPYKEANIKVNPSRDTDLPPIKLQLAATATAVEVTAQAETVQTTSPEISTTVTAEQISRLPVGDRNPLEFITTQAGIVYSPSGGETTINGQRSSFSNVTLDGINIQDNYIRTGGLDYIPAQLKLDQVQEFTVVTSNQGAAAFGGASQVNFATPSGTNQLHGNALWQNRNSSLAANDWFNNQDGIHPPTLNLNQLGGSLAGPIKRDKLFFFTNFEAYILRNQLSEDQTILTSDARNGIFSYIDAAGNVRKRNILQIMNLQPDPIMAQLLARVPGPEKINNFRVGDSQPGLLLNTAGYSFLVRNNSDAQNATGRLDYYLSTKHALAATYVWNRLFVDRPDIGIGYNSTPSFDNNDSRNFLSLAWRYTPAPNLTNEVRAGFYIAPGTFNYNGTLPSYLIGGTIYSTPDPASAATILAQGRNTRTYQAQDNASWVHGRHSLKFGYQFEGVLVRTYDFTGTVPAYNVGITSTNLTNNLLFPTDLPGVSAPDLNKANTLLASLAGLLDNAGVTFNVSSASSGFVPGYPYLRHFNFNNHAFYGQDAWKVANNLTFTAGLRWDYYSPVNERDSLELQPLLQGGSARATMLSDATLYFTGNSAGHPFYHRDLNNFGPSAGIAWDVFGNGKTAVRASYGINYVNDEAISVAEGFTTTNLGLSSSVFLPDLSGFMSTNRPVLTPPQFQVPLRFSDVTFNDIFATFGMLDPNLRTPYVQQWSFSMEQEFKGTIFEARYVGNHATKLLRGFNYDQEQLPANYLADFQRARQNGFLSQSINGTFNPVYNSRIPGSQPLTVLPRLPGGGFLTNGTVASLIQSGEAAELGYLYTYNGINGNLNFFPNPNALEADFVTNYSNSVYDSLQLDVRHRFQNGLEFQGNYVFEKWLADSAGTDQYRYEPFLDINNPGIGRARVPDDITHQFKANYSYELPFGEGHRIQKKAMNRLLSGWMTSGNISWLSGNPVSVYSGRGTFLPEYMSGVNEANTNLSFSQLQQIVGFRMTGNGPYFIAASAIGKDGRGVAADGQPAFNGQVFFNPGPGQVGSLQKRLFTGPNIFSMDAAIAKDTRLTERVRAQLRMEALNVFNHPTFAAFAQNINSTQFGKITNTATLPRELQLVLRLNF